MYPVLAGPHGFHQDHFKQLTLDENFQAPARRRAEPSRPTSGGEAPHEDTVILGINHGGPIPKKGP